MDIESVTCEITLEFWPGYSDQQGRLQTIHDLVNRFNELSSFIGLGDGADKYISVRTTRRDESV